VTESPRQVQTGTVGATPILVDVTSLGSAVAVSVQLTSNYVLANPRPPGFPFRPSMTGADTPHVDYPRTLTNGTVVSFLKCEADALIAAGAATLA